MKSDLPLLLKIPSRILGTITRFKEDDETLAMGTADCLPVLYLHNRAQVVIDYTGGNGEDSGDDILDKLAEMGISIDLINIFTDKKVFTVDGEDCERVARLLEERKAKFSIKKDAARLPLSVTVYECPALWQEFRALNRNNIRCIKQRISCNHFGACKNGRREECGYCTSRRVQTVDGNSYSIPDNILMSCANNRKISG